MRLHILAVGRLRKGPELTLIEDYLTRFERSGRPLGLSSVNVIEVEDKKGIGMSAEADLLRKAVPKGATIVAMDERGKLVTSPEFSNKIAGWRDNGCQDLAFLIGGADGIAPDLRQQVDFSFSFGKMVWPHMLVRVMLAEQLYRAASIMSGGPYHRA